jgi:hypothetical protein
MIDTNANNKELSEAYKFNHFKKLNNRAKNEETSKKQNVAKWIDNILDNKNYLDQNQTNL